MDQIVPLMVETMTDGIAELDQWATSFGLDLLSDEEVSDLRARIAEIQN